METHHTTLGAKANQHMMNEGGRERKTDRDRERDREKESDRDRKKQSLDKHCDK